MIDAVEEVCRRACPALEETPYDGWLIRRGDGITRRTNGVTVAANGRLPLEEKIAHCEAVFREGGQRPCFRILSTVSGSLDRLLDARGYVREDETRTMVLDFAAGLPSAPHVPVAVTDAASPEWLDAHRRISHADRPADEVARLQGRVRHIDVPTYFGAANGPDGEIVSIAYCAIHNGLGCLEWVATDPDYRRRGYSRAVVLTLLAAARHAGAKGACLPVVAANAPAVALYEALGFRDFYRYHYRLGPESPAFA